MKLAQCIPVSDSIVTSSLVSDKANALWVQMQAKSVQ